MCKKVHQWKISTKLNTKLQKCFDYSTHDFMTDYLHKINYLAHYKISNQPIAKLH